MTAFLKIDRCKTCGLETPWEWAPAIVLGGKPLAGTGVWRSALVDGLCARCWDRIATERERMRQAACQRERLIELLGGPKPYRAFTFERFQVFSGNSAAFEWAKRFDSKTENLYLWGLGRCGKTHLAITIARTCFERGGSIALTTPSQLVRKLRMKPPDEEQQAIDRFMGVDVLLLDDFVTGSVTPYARGVLREILDGRDFRDRGGLVVTSRYKPETLAHMAADEAIASRLKEMCQVIEVRRPPDRIRSGSPPNNQPRPTLSHAGPIMEDLGGVTP